MLIFDVTSTKLKTVKPLLTCVVPATFQFNNSARNKTYNDTSAGLIVLDLLKHRNITIKI